MSPIRFAFSKDDDRSQGTGIVYSFATDRKGGFSDDDTTLVQATLPALSLAMKAHAGHVIASGLLGTYLGEDAGRRVHAGSIMRGSVDNLRAVIWYADIRGFTTISDSTPGSVVVELLNDVFEILTASLRPRGGQVLKFIGDGMLAIFPFEDADRAETCRRALDAAIEAMGNIDALNAARAAAGAPFAPVDLALHLGEALYGNVGATDRLDFTVIGPAINEVARIEALCEPLGRAVLVSAEFVAGMTAADSRLESLGRHALRGVKEPKEIFALDLAACDVRREAASPAPPPCNVSHRRGLASLSLTPAPCRVRLTCIFALEFAEGSASERSFDPSLVTSSILREDYFMKTIAEIVRDRISTPQDLQEALQLAIQLEFATIPPYLCAHWSIDSDPGKVAQMIETIVVQEMFHFALAGNMLSAIGGTPSIANPAFIPSYPTTVLPGGNPAKAAGRPEAALARAGRGVHADRISAIPACGPCGGSGDDRRFLRHDRRGFYSDATSDRSERPRRRFRRGDADQERP